MDMEERRGGWVYIYRGIGLAVKESGGRVYISRGTGLAVKELDLIYVIKIK
jgi:hypothetical protein